MNFFCFMAFKTKKKKSLIKFSKFNTSSKYKVRVWNKEKFLLSRVAWRHKSAWQKNQWVCVYPPAYTFEIKFSTWKNDKTFSEKIIFELVIMMKVTFYLKFVYLKSNISFVLFAKKLHTFCTKKFFWVPSLPILNIPLNERS